MINYKSLPTVKNSLCASVVNMAEAVVESILVNHKENNQKLNEKAQTT